MITRAYDDKWQHNAEKLLLFINIGYWHNLLYNMFIVWYRFKYINIIMILWASCVAHFLLLRNTVVVISFGAHCNDVVMGAMASQITSLTAFYSTVYSGADQRQHQSPASLAFVWGIHRWQVNSPHKWPVTRKMFPFDDVTIKLILSLTHTRIIMGSN